MKCDLSDMTKGPLAKQILLFSLPLVATNLLQVMFNMADVAVVGRFAGAISLGAVGSTSMFVFLFTGLLIGIAGGINVLVALSVGAGKKKDIEETVHTSFILSIIIGLIISIIGIGISKPVLILLNTKTELLAKALLYLRVYLLGIPALALYNYGNAVLSAIGDTKKPLRILSMAGAINIVLNLVFVIGFRLDVKGVALASVISQYYSAFTIIRVLFTCNTSYGLYKDKLRLTKDKAIRVLKLGIPSGFQNALFYIANMFIQLGVNTFDATVVAGNAAATNADGLIFDMMAAFYTACGSFMGQNYGARNKKRMLWSYFISLGYAFGAAILVGWPLVYFGRYFLGCFTTDSLVIDAGMERLTVMGLTYCVSAFMDCANAASRSLGKSVIPMIIIILGACVFRVIWIYTVFAYFKTTFSLYILFIFSWVITATMGNIYFFKVYRRIVKDW